jgi:transposase
MSLPAERAGPVPEETARVARAAFPKGNVYMQMRDVLGVIYDDATFSPLCAARGRPAECPWRLALVTVMPFAEGLSDRQAAEAVRARIDGKYALGLVLDDAGFHSSVLCEVRARWLDGSLDHLLREALLAAGRTQGLLRRRGRQRTDSTHVLGVLRLLNRLEQVAETMRAALDALADAAPDWLLVHTPPEWFERYGRRVEEYRLPPGREAREAFARQVGADGMRLLADLAAPEAPPPLRDLPAVEVLRRTWVQRSLVWEGQVRLREPKDQPPAAEQMVSPDEDAARYATTRATSWVGYKGHVTETCDDDLPHLITDVGTPIAPAADVDQLVPLQERLAARQLPPAEHGVDTGYIRTSTLVASQREHQIDLVGPMSDDRQWQAKDPDGFDLAQVQIDWEARSVTCPNGQRSTGWSESRTARRRSQIHVQFAPAACAACPVRAHCTRAQAGPRHLTLRPRAEHDALRAARQRQTTATFKTQDAARAGIEGTLSQGVRAFGLRQTRYRGLAKTHLQHVATATAMNLMRLADWLNQLPRATTRRSRFAALAPTG